MDLYLALFGFGICMGWLLGTWIEGWWSGHSWCLLYLHSIHVHHSRVHYPDVRRTQVLLQFYYDQDIESSHEYLMVNLSYLTLTSTARKYVNKKILDKLDWPAWRYKHYECGPQAEHNFETMFGHDH